MSNSVECVKVESGVVMFDHSTGNMWANWNNGYSEHWPNKGYDVEQKLYSFYLMVEDFDKANILLYGSN